jgi:DNA polymerase epsilon subunit 1
LREMEWVWRGEHYSATSSDYSAIKAQLEAEKFPPRADGFGGNAPRYWADLSQEEQEVAKKSRLKMYSQKVYKRVLDKPVTQVRMAGICQRENGFYVDTVGLVQVDFHSLSLALFPLPPPPPPPLPDAPPPAPTPPVDP